MDQSHKKIHAPVHEEGTPVHFKQCCSGREPGLLQALMGEMSLSPQPQLGSKPEFFALILSVRTE